MIMKHLKTLLTTIAVLLCSISVSAYDFEVDGLWYDITSELEVEIVTETENFNGGDMVIPETVTYNGTTYNITSISQGAFQGNERITSLIISKNITSMGEYAFEWCRNLTSVSILGNLTSIGSSMFSGCSNLVSVTIPNSVTSIEGGAFKDCSSLTNISLPESLTEIGYSVFENCSKLTSIVIPQKVNLIKDGTFDGCVALKSIVVDASNKTYDSRNDCNAIIETKTNALIQGCASSSIPSTVTSIGDYAFDGCSSLTSLVVPNSVTKIGYGAFQGCSSMTSVNIPTGVTSIYSKTFNGCSSLESIIIPFTVTSIGDNAFMRCCSLKAITIPKSVTEIRQFTFAYCPNLTSIKVESGNTKYDSRNNCNAIIETNTNTLVQGCSSTIIPSSVTSIGNYAFYGCTNLTSITIPESVTKIDNGAFSGCSSLTTISLPKNITTLDQTFYGCTALKSITLPQNITTIESNAFGDCSSLASINIPKGVTTLKDNSFDGCTSLREVIFEDGTEDLLLGYKAFEDSPLETIYLGRNLTYTVSSGSGIFYTSKTLKSLTIGDNVKEVKSYQFQNCENLTSVVIGNGVTKIGQQAFYGCSKLAVVEHSTSSLVLESNAFGGCTSLKSFNLDGITSIYSGAFSDSGLESIHFPESVQNVEMNAFSNMKNLKTISVAKDFNADLRWGMPFCPAIESITVEEGNTRFDSRDNCNALIQIVSGNAFLLIGSKNAIIPNGVNVIGPYAFMGMPIAEEIVIPSSVNQILGFAFENTTPKYIICHSVTPPTVDEHVFSNVDTSTPIYVPTNSITDYYTASGWSKFTNIYPLDNNIDIIDNGEGFLNKVSLFEMNISYTRTFNNTNWQALYVPFAMSYEDWAEEFDVAKINDIHQFDEDGDDVLETTKMEIVKVKSGTLKANHPYMIRAKSTGEKTITVENATLMAAEAKTIDCSSVELKYTFTGTYETVDGETMVNNNYYAMSGGGLNPTTNTNASLKPFRWYMQITDREGQVVQDVSEVKVVVRGEDDWDATGIDEIETTGNTFVIHGIDGRMVRKVNANTLGEATEGLASGMYVINGKKHIVNN